MLKRSLAFLGMMAAASISSAAEITMREEAGQTVVTMSGRLVDYDARVFLSMTANVRRGTVVPDSDGGSLYAGVEIGKAIGRLGLESLVFVQDW